VPECVDGANRRSKANPLARPLHVTKHDTREWSALLTFMIEAPGLLRASRSAARFLHER
jgi:hypothetical protein